MKRTNQINFKTEYSFSKNVGLCHFNAGLIYREREDLDKASQQFALAYEFLEKTSDKNDALCNLLDTLYLMDE